MLRGGEEVVKERKVGAIEVIFPRGRVIDMLCTVVLPNHRVSECLRIVTRQLAKSTDIDLRMRPDDELSWNQLGIACIGRGSRENICPGRLQWQRVARHWLVSREGSI